MLPYVFRLHGFFVSSKLNTQAIIHDARREPVQEQGGCRLPSRSVRVQGCCCRAGWRWADVRHHKHFLTSEQNCCNDYGQGQHSGALVITVASQQEGSRLDPQAWGLSVCSIFTLYQRVLFFGFLTLSKGVHTRWIRNAKSAIGVYVSVNGCWSFYVTQR